MKFGMGFYTGQRPTYQERSHTQLYKDLMNQVKLAEDVGLDCIWLAEHHFFEDGFINALMPISAALGAVTSRIMIGADVTFSLYNPIRLAEDAIALDHITKGRFLLGMAGTYLDQEFEPFGLDPKAEAERLDELLIILRTAFSNKTLDFSGKHYRISSCRITPEPHTEGGPGIVLGSHGNPDHETKRAARDGDHYRTNPMWPIEEIQRLVKIFGESREPDDGAEVFVYNYGFISDTEDPWEIMEPGFRHIRLTYDRMAKGKIPEHIKVASEAVEKSRVGDRLKKENFRLLIGNSDEVMDQIKIMRDLIGDRLHLVLRLSYPGLHPDKVNKAIELYGGIAEKLR